MSRNRPGRTGDARAETACLLAERLRAGVSEWQVRVPGQKTAMQCTVSIGVSQPDCVAF